MALFCSIGIVSAAEKGTQAVQVSKSGDLAIGLVLGSPTGISLKYWTASKSAFDAALGLPFDSDVKFHFHADYLWHAPTNANVPGEMPFYIGLGGRLRAIDKSDETSKIDFGLRIPVGLEFIAKNVPLDVFAEIAPVVVFIPKGTLNLDGGIGIRYRFGGASTTNK